MTAFRNFENRDPVPSLPQAAVRPKWSVMIPVYNSARFLASTLQSVLAQAPDPAHMQIEVVDDCSSDDPQKVVNEIGGRRVGFFRQPQNLGHIGNFHTCLSRAQGELVHLLHGDDAVRPEFYELLGRGFDADPRVGAAFCRTVFMDAHGQELSIEPAMQSVSGRLENAVIRLALEQRIMTPSIAVRRAVYEELGGFDRRLKCSEDWEMWIRIASRFPVWYEPQALALYRMHPQSNTGRHIRNAADMAYTRMAIDIFKSYLPSELADDVAASARRTYSQSALETGRRLLGSGDWAGCLAQMSEAFHLDPSLKTIGRMLWLVAKQGGEIVRPN
ncbi:MULTISPECIES: glycosyltransferase [unclassified Mesorhizobium]|uniref:glycosyltransferase family 2 protein n=1 Tax=unclassified Mesorhizobium TaxID=325217 RepID=UPI00112D829A|nr:MULTISPECIES: glycosyltransferase [unclassified Mesorhizobium]MCA0025677.1 glycosyltransferase [Mesorhizobium sp. B263B1A]TPJ47877.1 glycosyltransferase [Mesorhizobium sp. B2-6-4]TPJ92382.1 glycosyltransferase [Mesorhizobium sp. B2-5-12]TPK21219.1 glycosyltransferase [Mesorhizobium sp. B2-5-6]TPM43520.1 glycosyltransferase [Mesorhizobium sp. B2-2-3]